ncbi:MAG: sulfurtransferase [Deltaproteobacteria bacterium]|nr:MAG: sulfurtransferase [Deltaproteobacteria bacterium]
MAPFNVTGLADAGSVLLFVAIGFAFGYILESSGFGDSRKLTGQFYFTDLAVLKVMFTAVVVAMVGIVWASTAGLLNFDDLWVNHTYVIPGMVGGAIMGVGFVVGGYCPGTSLVSMATLKKDGAVFVLGALLGMFVFGESVEGIIPFMDQTDLGRMTVGDALGVSPGVVAALATALALALFVGADWVKRKLHGTGPEPAPRIGRFTLPAVGAGALSAVVVPLLFISPPSYLDKWEKMTDKHALISDRKVQIDPAELLETMNDDSLRVELLDLRPEPAFNRFHIQEAQRANLEGLAQARQRLTTLPLNTVVVLVDQEEKLSTEGFKLLTAMGVRNVYVLEGGVDHWLHVFEAKPMKPGDGPALGDRWEVSRPDLHHMPHREFEKKIKLATKAKRSGGCG